MITQWIKSQHPELTSKLLCSRDTLYITQTGTDEQYIYPLCKVRSISFKLALHELTQQERLDYEVAPMEMLLIVDTVKSGKMYFLARNTNLAFDYLGYEEE